jgi:uncharacterized membrane protein
MASIKTSLLLDVPASYAFQEWTDIANYPRFFQGVDAVDDLGDGTLQWRGRLDGQPAEWRTATGEVVEDELVTWLREGAPTVRTTVSFAPLAGPATWIIYRVEQSWLDTPPDLAQRLEREAKRMDRELRAFRDLVEGSYAARAHRLADCE